MDDTLQIRADFDSLAGYQEAAWNHNTQYHGYLLQHLPLYCRHILEIGCGKGDFTRRLADRAEQVTAVDLSPYMIRKAWEQSSDFNNIAYVEADFMTFAPAAQPYDAIVSLATLHHLPLDRALQKISSLLKPEGMLVILDLYTGEGVRDVLRSAVAVGVHQWLNVIRNHGYRMSAEERQMWDEHGKRDTYPTIAALRQHVNGYLPGSVIKKHLLWRYSLIWEKPPHQRYESPLYAGQCRPDPISESQQRFNTGT